MSVSLERLSSGLRINSARDDAAGVAIAGRLTALLNGQDQAVRNANDGISLLQTAEGALRETSTLLQRMRELAVQSANATLATADRAGLQKELDALVDEVSRIVDTTEYNGIRLFSASSTIVFQVGSQGEETHTITIDTVDLTSAASSLLSPDAPLRENPKTGGGKVYVHLPDGSVETIQNTTGLISDLKNAIAAASGISADEQLLYFEGMLLGDDNYTSQYNIQNKDDLYLELDDPSQAALSSYDDGTTVDISGQASSQRAIDQIDDDLDSILSLRATYGAVQSRLESAIRNLENTSGAIAASRSRIQDADLAAEMSSLTRSLILQKSGQAVLSQANIASRNVLNLLAGPAMELFRGEGKTD